MICKKCGCNVSEDALICPTCGEKVALERQVERLKIANQAVKDTVVNSFNGNLFLVLGIFITILCGAYFINALVNLASLQTNFLGALVNIVVYGLYAAFALVSTIITWKMYTKKAKVETSSVNNFNSFNSFGSVMSIVTTVFVGIVCALALLGSIIIVLFVDLVKENMEAALENMEDENVIEAVNQFLNLDSGTLIIIVIIVVALVMAYFVNLCISYKKMKNYVIVLSQTVATGNYKVVKRPPFIRLFIVGGVCSFFGLLSLVAADIFSFLLYVSLGCYLILSGVFFDSIHKALNNRMLELEKEKNIYEEISKASEEESKKYYEELRKLETQTKLEEEQQLTNENSIIEDEQ